MTRMLLFQSLFSWNLFLMIDVYTRIDREELVSILVFVELVLDGYSGPDRKQRRTKFQSLFSWNLFLMNYMGKIKGRHNMFQSLFSWNLFLMFGRVVAAQ